MVIHNTEIIFQYIKYASIIFVEAAYYCHETLLYSKIRKQKSTVVRFNHFLRFYHFLSLSKRRMYVINIDVEAILPWQQVYFICQNL